MNRNESDWFVTISHRTISDLFRPFPSHSKWIPNTVRILFDANRLKINPIYSGTFRYFNLNESEIGIILTENSILDQSAFKLILILPIWKMILFSLFKNVIYAHSNWCLGLNRNESDWSVINFHRTVSHLFSDFSSHSEWIQKTFWNSFHANTLQINPIYSGLIRDFNLIESEIGMILTENSILDQSAFKLISILPVWKMGYCSFELMSCIKSE